MQRARLVDVARLAGVSLGSASRALSMPDLVKPKTLAAVRAAVATLGYVPNGRARSLALGRSLTVGAMVPTVNNPVYADFTHALQQTLGQRDHLLLVVAHEYDRTRQPLIVGHLLERGVDGLILVGTDQDSGVYRQLDAAGIPHIFAWSTDEAAKNICVGFSNRRAMQSLASHLLQLGHTDIVLLSGPTEYNERARARIEGARDAMRLAGHALREDRILYGDFSISAGRDGVRRLLEMVPRPTAIICSTDLVAAGAMAEARDQGIAVPDELSIAGFDDIEFAAITSPALTTVKVPALDIGREAGRLILSMMDGSSGESHEFETELVVRASTSPPRKI